MKKKEQKIFFGDEIENSALYTDIGEDMRQRPKLFRFLKQIQKNGRIYHGPIPYSLLHNAFWSSLQYLANRDQTLIVDSLIFNLKGEKIAKKHDVSRMGVHIRQKKASEKLEIHIIERLKTERILMGFRD